LSLFKRLFCKHENIECLTNFHGDCINIVSTSKKIYRSAWRCKGCGKIIYSEYLDNNCKTVNWTLHK